jgi:hypothetical protein
MWKTLWSVVGVDPTDQNARWKISSNAAGVYPTGRDAALRSLKKTWWSADGVYLMAPRRTSLEKEADTWTLHQILSRDSFF